MNDVPLRDYFERLLDERDRAHSSQMAAADKAIQQAAAALTVRLEHMNEFRGQIEKERALYVRRDQLDPLLARLGLLEGHRATLDGRFWALGVVLAIALSLLTTALRIWMR